MNGHSEIAFVECKNLKIWKNSRWRADSNMSELMESIKQSGILQPIVARKEDNIVICGNRRLAAATKLGMSKVPVIFRTGISDKEVLILNLTENMQRKDISSIEIGKICHEMLRNAEFKMSINELATAVGVNSHRIKTCLDAFRHLPPEFRDRVVHIESAASRKYGELPENIVMAVLGFGRQYGPINGTEMKFLLRKVGEEKLTTSQIVVIGRLVQAGMPLKKAVKEVDTYKVCRLDVPVVKNELKSLMKKAGSVETSTFLRDAIREKYPGLVF